MVIYIKFDGIDGHVTAKGQENWIEISYYDWDVLRKVSGETSPENVTHREANKPTINPLNIKKPLDQTTQQLHIVRFKNLHHAIYVLNELAVAPNPMQSVLDIIQQNNAPVQNSQLKVATIFETLNTITDNAKDKPAP